MIFGGSTDGDSNRARKARGKRDFLEVKGARKNELVISFGPNDLQGVSLPHNDVLVIQARVSNYDVLRIFMDSGSSVNVIFKEALVQMDLQRYQLGPIEPAFSRFCWSRRLPIGRNYFAFDLGHPRNEKNCHNHFYSCGCPFIIQYYLGRPAMNELKVVASTYHQKIQFPVENQVVEVRGDQPSSRKCYVETVLVDQNKARREKKEGGRTEEVERITKKGKELVGISSLVAKHSLNIIPGSQPVKQKKKHFGLEKDKVIEVQVAGKWMMCVDFMDLNKAYPKDHYHLLQIDQPVDSNSSYELLSFVDSYQGYHQILLAKTDQDKSNISVLNESSICEAIGRNNEVYVDDILGNSREISCFIPDLEETLATLSIMRLSPTRKNASLE
ncbi:uncharacterized protein [Primulina eburnea]|uniref:uncharacterized protein n=1 Tax=Primulina eburnea TaxID=1245227 RepID=UPI003C6BE669